MLTISLRLALEVDAGSMDPVADQTPQQIRQSQGYLGVLVISLERCSVTWVVVSFIIM